MPKDLPNNYVTDITLEWEILKSTQKVHNIIIFVFTSHVFFITRTSVGDMVCTEKYWRKIS